MQLLTRHDVVGRRLAEVIISQPDKPVSDEDQSYSSGYVRLDSGVLIELDSSEAPRALDLVRLRHLARDSEHERSFQPAIGQKVVDLLRSDEHAGICVLLESGSVIAFVPGRCWIAPSLLKRDEFPLSTATTVWER
jgi:hypothetical protein